MKTNDDLVPVREFITESERNLEIATAVYEQYEAAREAIVSEFFARLSVDLKSKLPDWTSCYTTPFFTERWGAFELFKKRWKERYRIRMEAYDHGGSMIFGVWREPGLLNGISRSAVLLKSVRQVFPEATSRAVCEAAITMTSPAADWRTPNVLWRMKTDDSFRAEVEAILLQMVELTETHIDALVKAVEKAKGS